MVGSYALEAAPGLAAVGVSGAGCPYFFSLIKGYRFRVNHSASVIYTTTIASAMPASPKTLR